jgi:hypothetical protein
MTAKPTGTNAASWKGSGADDQHTPPSWSLTPTKPTILDPYATIDFELSPITIPRPAGQGDLYLMYTHVPGYDDGYLRLTIEKHPPPPTITASVKPQIIDTSKGWVPVTLTWKTTDADIVLLDGIVQTDTTTSRDVNGTKQFLLTASQRGATPATAEVWVYDFPSFLELHTFTLVTSKEEMGEWDTLRLTLNETLRFKGDHTGVLDVVLDGKELREYRVTGQLPIKWSAVGDTVTIVTTDPEFSPGRKYIGRFEGVARIANDALEWLQPLPHDRWVGDVPDRKGVPFAATNRSITPSHSTLVS